MRRSRRAALAGAGGLALVLAACNAIVGLDQDYAAAPDGLDAGALGDASQGDGSPRTDAEVGDAGEADADAGEPCPGTAGPSMVRIGSYCIDSTEVTEADYAQFLAADAGFAGPRPAACAWKTDFVPGKAGLTTCRWDPASFPHLPVTCVDWCDAYAYCQWAGKRLCGAIDGGPIPWASDASVDPEQDEWYRACSKAGAGDFPYGDTYDLGECNDSDAGIHTLADAGSMRGCAGGYEGLFDMVGNAFEFENSCSDDTGPDDYCLLRGGSWAKSRFSFSRCSGRGEGDLRNARHDDLGIRCCSR